MPGLLPLIPSDPPWVKSNLLQEASHTPPPFMKLKVPLPTFLSFEALSQLQADICLYDLVASIRLSHETGSPVREGLCLILHITIV